MLWILITMGCEEAVVSGEALPGYSSGMSIEYDSVECPYGDYLVHDPPDGGTLLRLEYCSDSGSSDLGDIFCVDYTDSFQTNEDGALVCGSSTELPEGSYFQILWLVPTD